MSFVNTLALESNRQIKINFDGGDLSSDAGLLYQQIGLQFFYIICVSSEIMAD